MLMFLGPFLAGYHMINFSPLSFLADPLVWLRAISKYRGIWTASPDFGYQLCTKRAAANAPPKDIDLRSLCALGCGAGQRVVPSILREFAAYWRRARLPDYGNYGIFYPSFGMAEHVVATCGETGGLIPSRQRPDLVSCGSDFVVDLLVVDAETRRVLPDGTPGEMWLCSDSVALGYWGKPKLSNETFRARVEPDDGRVYLRTGDEAFIEDGRLFICGRIKDMIIIGGENYYSDDVEIAATEAVGDAARPGCIAAFAVVDDDDENECLCIVLEVRDSAVSECETLASTLRKSVRKAVGLTPRRVVFIKQKTILKTTSGKLRRRAIRGALLAGDLSVVFDSNPGLGAGQPQMPPAVVVVVANEGDAPARNDDDDDNDDSAEDGSAFSRWIRSWLPSSSSSDSAADPPPKSRAKEEVCDAAPRRIEDPTLKWSECLLSEAQDRGRPYELSDFLGVWEVLDDHYAIQRFRINADNAIDDDDDDSTGNQQHHHLGCGRFTHEAAVVAKVVITKHDADARPGVLEDVVARLPHKLYVLVLHASGLVKFVPHAASSRRLLALVESYDSLDAEMNLEHAENFGCFRFGIVVGNSTDRRLIRLNRWATDNRYFWSAVNVTNDFPDGVDEPRKLVAAGLAAHPGVDGTTPAGTLRDAIVAFQFDDENNERATVERTTTTTVARAASAIADVDFLPAEKNLPGTDHRESSSFPGGSAIVRRVAKQIASLFPPGTSLKDHPDIPAIFRLLLKVPDELMQRLEYDESIVDVAVFVDVIASNVLRMPVLLQVAQELETHQPGWNLPISDERAAADLRRAVCYCFALHAIGISTLRPAKTRSDFFLDFLNAQEAALKTSRNAVHTTSSPFELMNRESVLSAARNLAEARRDPSRLATARAAGGLLADTLIIAAIENVSKKSCDRNARAAPESGALLELAYWSCVLQQQPAAAALVEVSTSSTSRGAELVRFETCPAMMMSEWVQTYIVCNLSLFGSTEPSCPFLFHIAKLLVPCLLSLTNEDPAFFLWMRAATWNAHEMVSCRRELKNQLSTTETYDWRLTEATTALLGRLSERLACQSESPPPPPPRRYNFYCFRAARKRINFVVGFFMKFRNFLCAGCWYYFHHRIKLAPRCQLSSAISAKIAKNRRSPLLLEVDREQIATLFSKKRDQILEKYKMLLRSCTANDQKECCIRGHGWLDKIRSRVTESGDAAHEGRIRRDDNPPPPPPPPKGKDDVSIQIVHQSRHDATDDDALETAVRREQAAYVQATLLRVLASTAETTTQIDDAQVTSVARLGLTSQDALAVQTELWRDLSVEVDFNTLMDPNLSIAQLADKITRIARGEDETPLEEAAAPSRLVPLSNEKVLLLEATTKLPQWVCDMVQALSVVVVVVLVSLALVPSYRWGRWVQWRGNSIGTKRIDVRRDNSPWSHIKIAGTSKVFIYGLGIPLVIPTFMTSLSLVFFAARVVISAKWLCVGRQRPTAIAVGSSNYLRWWIVERLFDQWEMWCGDFLKDTVLINAFYRACGCDVPVFGARINTLLRDLDLVAVGRGASVEGRVYARSFYREGETLLLGLRFARVVINGIVEKSAVVELGVEIEEGAILRQLSVASQFSRLEGGGGGGGKTASPRRRRRRRCSESRVMIELAKLALLVPLLYAPFVTTSTAVAWTMRRVGWYALSFRYRPLAWWVLSYYGGLFVLVTLVIACKWLLIGRARSGSTRFEMRAWFVDYFWHRIVVRLSGLLFQGNGLATNGLLRALGVDVDWSARFVSAEAVSASEADVITVEARAQISQCVVSCLTAASSYAPVRIGRDAEVGLDAYLEAGTVIGEDSVVGQQTLASGIVPPGSVKLGKITFRRRQSSRGTGNNSTKNGGGGGDLRLALVPFVSRTLLLALFGFVALIPSYELAVLVLFGSSNFYEDQDYLSGANEDGSRWTPPVDRNLGLLCIGPISLVAFACMSLVCRLWTYLVFGNFRRLDGTSRWVFEAFHEYQFMIIYASHKFAMPLLQGSRLAVAYMRFWGADVDWTAFINNQLFYEPPLLSLEAGCVVDQGVWHLGHVFISVSRYF